MTAPIKVGNIELDNPVLLAPMSGITDMPFRLLSKRYGAGYVVSEMIASEALVRECDIAKQKATFDPRQWQGLSTWHSRVLRPSPVPAGRQALTRHQ